MPEVPVPEATPDLGELLQEQPLPPTVPVRGEGAFLTQALPSRRVQADTDIIPSGSWTPLLPATPKRASTILIASDKGFRYSTNGMGRGMAWPVGVPLPLHNTEAVYLMADDPAGSTVSHLTELWAD